MTCLCTIDVERFGGLNICGFSPSVYYLPIAKNSRENFRGTLKTVETTKVEPSESFTVMVHIT